MPAVPVDERSVAVERRPPLHAASLICSAWSRSVRWPATTGTRSRRSTRRASQRDRRRSRRARRRGTSSTAGRLRDHRFVAVDGGARPRLGGPLADLVASVLRGRRRALGLRQPSALAAGASGRRSWPRSSRAPTPAASGRSRRACSRRTRRASRCTSGLGFRVVGRRERIAQLDGAWRDTLLLERRV